MCEWVRLEKLKCPAQGCPSSEPVDWVCSKDGNDVYINEEGKIKCAAGRDVEGEHIDDLCKWGLKCNNEFHAGQHIKADFKSFSFAMSSALIFTRSESSLWVAKLILALGKQYGI